jgi:hypothetical protein
MGIQDEAGTFRFHFTSCRCSANIIFFGFGVDSTMISNRSLMRLPIVLASSRLTSLSATKANVSSHPQHHTASISGRKRSSVCITSLSCFNISELNEYTQRRATKQHTNTSAPIDINALSPRRATILEQAPAAQMAPPARALRTSPTPPTQNCKTPKTPKHSN